MSYPFALPAHFEPTLLKPQNLPACWFPNWFVLAGNQGTCQPKKFSHRKSPDLDSASWDRTAAAGRSCVTHKFKPSQRGWSQQGEKQEEDERAEERKGLCVIRCSLLTSSQSLIQLGRERECTFLKDISRQTSLLQQREAEEP